jgi:beta-lactamase regulating signal transducer with metallopeptidase domain
MCVWLAGTVFLLVRLWRGNRQVGSLLSDAQPFDDRRLDKSLEIAAGVLVVKSLPPIVMSPSIACPVVAGLVRPTVVLPVEFVRNASAEQLADVLIHECAHAVRRDTSIGLAQRLVQLAFWPHPFVYVMNRSLSRAREEVCDNYVFRRGDAAGYAQTLLELAQHYGGRPMPQATLAMFSPRWKLEDRVAGLSDPRRRQGTQVGRAKFAALAALLVIGGSTMAAGQFDESHQTGVAVAQAPRQPAAPAGPALTPNDRVLLSLDKPR